MINFILGFITATVLIVVALILFVRWSLREDNNESPQEDINVPSGEVFDKK